MPTKGTKATSRKKKRIAVKDLPAAEKRVSAKDMKKVKGGYDVSPTQQAVLKQQKVHLGGVITTKTGGG